MDRDSILILTKIIIDFLCVFAAGMGVLMFYIYGEPFKRGLFCSDESLKYPYAESTVTSTMLYVTGLFLPICVMILGEFTLAKKQRGQSARVFLGYTIPPWIWKAYYHVGIFGFGAASTALITDIAKYSIGRLRPHFLTICNTSVCSVESNLHTYITDIQCNSTYGDKVLREGRLSFPSGHSSFSAYTMLYLILYLQVRIQWKNTKLLKHIVQLICFVMAWFTALSRISNYKHHWSDVLAGSALGVTMALVVANFVAGLFKAEKPSKEAGVTIRETEYETEGTQNESSPLRNCSTRYDGVPVDL